MALRDFATVATQILELLPEDQVRARAITESLINTSYYTDPAIAADRLWWPLTTVVNRTLGPGWTPQDPNDLWKVEVASLIAGRDVRNDPPRAPRPAKTDPPTIYQWRINTRDSSTFGLTIQNIEGQEHHGGPITTSPVMCWHPDAGTVTTVSGSVYQLDGEPLSGSRVQHSLREMGHLRLVKSAPRHLRHLIKFTESK